MRALRATGGSASNEELLGKVVELEGISDDVASMPHVDGRQSKLGYNTAWAKTYLKKAGFIENSQRGIWSLTELGEGADLRAIEAVPAELRKAYVENRKDQATESPLSVEPEQDAESQDLISWRDQMLKILRSLEPASFERLAQRLLREAGFVKVEVTGRSGDGGIDGVGVLRLNLLRGCYGLESLSDSSADG